MVRPTYYRILLFSFLCIVGLVLTGCRTLFPMRYAPNPVAAPDVSTRDLLLDASAFPPDWIVHQCDPHCDRTERNGNSIRGFYITGVPGHVNQHVMYFDTEVAAKIKFERYRETDLSDNINPNTVQTPSTVFLPPDEIDYQSPLADEQYLGCGVDVVPACKAGLRYGNYFIYFYFSLHNSYYLHFLDESEITDKMRRLSVEEGGLRLSEVEQVLQAMDEHYAELFGVSIPDE